MDTNIVNMIEDKIEAVNNIIRDNVKNNDDKGLIQALYFKIILLDLLRKCYDYYLPNYRLEQIEELSKLTRELKASLNR